jgi:hypothetical protein
MSVLAAGIAFTREHLRTRLNLVLLLTIPAVFVLLAASVLGDFATALGGKLGGQGATALGAGWAAAYVAGVLGFFEVPLVPRRRPPAGPGRSRSVPRRHSPTRRLAGTRDGRERRGARGAAAAGSRRTS